MSVYVVVICNFIIAISMFEQPSLTWPDRYFSVGAYRLEIISAHTEKGLVQFAQASCSQNQQRGVGC